ncbi:MAG: HAMP domain-containing histidine kinase [Lachnospiraceae bacterium]|nr:HAMP domain-containing histidine kinase [Lachnospiraceae bacterium]
MSSNPKPYHDVKSTGRMTSIAHQLEWQIIGSRLGLYVRMDLFLFVVLTVMWAYMKEMEVLGEVIWRRDRSLFSASGALADVCYQVHSMEGELLLSVACYEVFWHICIFLAICFGVQLISILGAIPAVAKKVHRILRPIREIAQKTDELNRLAFSEEKYHLIEDAIDQVNPEDNHYISLHDKELLGIELAVNHLIERLKDSYRQQARFVNDASHELRTPIAVIQGYAGMLERWGRSDEKVLDESIAAISNEANHMNTLVEQLLFLARGDSGKTVLNKEPFSLNQLMQEIYEESFMIDEHHPYRFRNSEREITVNADRALLKQAVRILVDNAAKYTKEMDEIILGIGLTSEQKPYLMVEDTGIGMSEADVAHMFERFYRSDEARGYQGTGLGLSIAKWIVDRHGGHFEVISRTELGTRIMIVL